MGVRLPPLPHMNWSKKLITSIKKNVRYSLKEPVVIKSIPTDDPTTGFKPERIKSLSYQIIKLRVLGFDEASLALRRTLLEETFRICILNKTGKFTTKVGEPLLSEFKLLNPNPETLKLIEKQLNNSSESLHKYSHGIMFSRVTSIKRIRKIKNESYKNMDGKGSLEFFTANGSDKPKWYVKYRALFLEYFSHVNEYSTKSENDFFGLIKSICAEFLIDFPMPPFYEGN